MHSGPGALWAGWVPLLILSFTSDSETSPLQPLTVGSSMWVKPTSAPEYLEGLPIVLPGCLPWGIQDDLWPTPRSLHNMAISGPWHSLIHPVPYCSWNCFTAQEACSQHFHHSVASPLQQGLACGFLSGSFEEFCLIETQMIFVW